MAMKSARERAEEKREEKLEQVREQVQNGSLVIRQMTDEERLRYPPKDADTKRPKRW
jgi:anti-sigma28 factor (negative regulator of flagellin synthesis)